MKMLRYGLEGIVVYILFFIFRFMPVDWASAVGGFLGREIGPRLASSRKAVRNIEYALPTLSADERCEIVRGMWDNLGRIFAEYPHLAYLSAERTSIEPIERKEYLEHTDQNIVFIGAHIGNWEVNAASQYMQMDKSIDLTYRAPNNPFVDRLLYNARTLGQKMNAHAKSRTAGRKIIQTLSAGKSVGFLVDQKYNEGLAIPFFGYPAMTNPVFVQLAQKFECPIVPVRCLRLPGRRVKFKMIIEESLQTFNDDGTKRPIDNILMDVHKVLERWITQTPEQWLWLHRRWDSMVFSENTKR